MYYLESDIFFFSLDFPYHFTYNLNVSAMDAILSSLKYFSLQRRDHKHRLIVSIYWCFSMLGTVLSTLFTSFYFSFTTVLWNRYLLSFPFYRKRKWIIAWSSNFPKITLLLDNKVTWSPILLSTPPWGQKSGYSTYMLLWGV